MISLGKHQSATCNNADAERCRKRGYISKYCDVKIFATILM